MNTPNDGGPAFPRPTSFSEPGVVHMVGHPGMSLRDWFAGMALQGQLSLPQVQQAIAADTLTALDIAGASYEYADAMLSARNS